MTNSHDRLPDLIMPFDPPADRLDPYREYARYRSQEPVVVRDVPGLGTLAWVFRYDDVIEALQNHERFSNGAARVFLGPTLGEGLLVGYDPPEHGQLRRLVAPAFTPAVIAGMKDGILRQTVGELLRRMEDMAEPDIVQDLAFILPAKMISRMLGLPEEDFEFFRELAMEIILVAAEPETAMRAADQLRNYIRRILSERRAEPRDDLISKLVSAEVDGETLSEDQAISFILTLLPAGIETTYRTLGNLCARLLLEDLWPQLVAEPGLIKPAIDEALRHEAPLQVVFRTAIADTEIAGVPIKAGTFVIPVLGSANRDELANPDPNSFDLHRKGRRIATFGGGVHTCLGMFLAKLELQVAMEELISRFPGLRLSPGEGVRREAQVRGLMVRSPKAVRVQLSG